MSLLNIVNNKSLSEFNEFQPRLKSPKNRFQLSAGLNLEKFKQRPNLKNLSRGLNLSQGSNMVGFMLKIVIQCFKI